MKRSAHHPIFKNTRRRGKPNPGSMVGTPPAPDPLELSIVGSVTHVNLDRVDRVIVDGAYCYLTSPPNDRLSLVNVSVPTAPVYTSNRTSSASLDIVNDLAKIGNYIIVANGADLIISSHDVSVPATPTFGSSLFDANFANGKGISIVGNYAYVLGRPTGGPTALTSVDVSNPLAMVVVDVITHANFGTGSRVAAAGSYAYVTGDATTDAVTIIDISDPTNLAVAGTISDATDLSSPGDLIVDGTIIYVMAGGLASVDVSVPATPVILDTIAAGGSGICKIGNHVFTCNSVSNLVTAIDVSDPSDMVIVDTITDATFLGGVSDLACDGSYIYAAVFSTDRLTILELS
jgi:hypothetical protein